MNLKTYPNLIYASTAYATNLLTDSVNHSLLECNYSKMIYETFVGHDRFSKNDNVFGLKVFNKFVGPDFSNISPITFSEATDKTTDEFIMLANKIDLPISVYWSGGIDSTVVLAALVKNFSKSMLDRVTVVMNNASYFENPHFFDTVIKPNLNYTNDMNYYDWDNSLVLNGDPADKIWIHANIVEIELENKGSFSRSLQQPDILLRWMSKRSSKEFAEWLFHEVIQSATDVGVTLENYSDFYWWINFAFFYTGCAFSSFTRHYNGSDTYWKNYSKNFFSWYNTEFYQEWSVYAQHTGEKFKGTISNYKMPAKEYIYDVDLNDWYRKYKTKAGSNKYRRKYDVLAIYDDGRVIATSLS